MATNTTNLNLIKPSGTDKIRIAQINQNMDILDEKIGPVGNTSLQAQVNAINPKRPAINSLASDNYILGLQDGVYQVALNAASDYLPERYGTLVINRSGSSYGVATFASTTGKTYFRHMNGTSAWHNNAWIRVALDSQIESLNSQIATRAKAARQSWGTTMTAENFGLGLLLINYSAAYVVWFAGTSGINIRSLRASDGGKSAEESITFSADSVDGTGYTITRNGTTMQITAAANATMTVLYT